MDGNGQIEWRKRGLCKGWHELGIIKMPVLTEERNMGTNYYLVKNRPSVERGLHIGKSSIGWRFLFYKPSEWEADRPLNTFEQWRDYLKETTDAGAHVIMDEYDEIVPCEKLMKLIAAKQEEDSPDMFDYCENVNGYRFSDREFS